MVGSGRVQQGVLRGAAKLPLRTFLKVGLVVAEILVEDRGAAARLAGQLLSRGTAAGLGSPRRGQRRGGCSAERRGSKAREGCLGVLEELPNANRTGAVPYEASGCTAERTPSSKSLSSRSAGTFPVFRGWRLLQGSTKSLADYSAMLLCVNMVDGGAKRTVDLPNWCGEGARGSEGAEKRRALRR